MRFLRYLSRNATLLNILLLGVLGALIAFVSVPEFRMRPRYKLPRAKSAVSVVQESETAKPEKEPSPLDFAVIADANLYHPKRRIPPEKKADQPLAKPDLVLYGTTVGPDVTVAFIEDKKSPKNSPGRGKRQSVVRIGSVLSGFAVRDIQTDKIVLTRGEETMVVPLMDKNKRRGGEATSGTTNPAAPSKAPAQAQKPVQARIMPSALPPVTGSPGALPSPVPRRNHIPR